MKAAQREKDPERSDRMIWAKYDADEERTRLWTALVDVPKRIRSMKLFSFEILTSATDEAIFID